ncbi:MAG: hypothetical protein BWK72_18340 [Rhodoferax ferrireducens]|uniref:Virulence-associated protein E n=1 Tax=Rhodoferax ferrireducens TaxID=192843 RepID=A0A1W9KPZ3_9BURK|nr:MAG: hypothetical protein BWK72_18340 [Rhodoferax ferrireducens]
MSAAPIDNILPLLSKVKQRQPGQWSACCPAHDDKGPSLSIRELPTGEILLFCFSGCGASAILAALGLDFKDLYPPREPSGREPNRYPRLLTAGQALELLETEARLVAVAAANVLHGVMLHQPDLDRLTQAAGRIAWLREEASALGGHRHD